jgi:hypothetical protein
MEQGCGSLPFASASHVLVSEKPSRSQALAVTLAPLSLALLLISLNLLSPWLPERQALDSAPPAYLARLPLAGSLDLPTTD